MGDSTADSSTSPDIADITQYGRAGGPVPPSSTALIHLEDNDTDITMKAGQLFVKCLENEGVDYIFGIPGEENIDLMDALHRLIASTFVTTHHEQGAAFMADVYGRLTGRAGVCLSTLGPGATNLVTGVADANMDHAPLVAIAGQADTNRLHKESHQMLDLQNMFEPITKYSTRPLTPNIITEVVRKAFKLAQTEKTGACFIEFPENIAEMPIDDTTPAPPAADAPEPSSRRVSYAAEVISNARDAHHPRRQRRDPRPGLGGAGGRSPSG